MRKCIMVKIGGSRKRQLNKKNINLTKIGGNLWILRKYGRFIHFLEIEGNIQYASLAYGDGHRLPTEPPWF